MGALLYAAVNTRPDVAYSVGLLCRAMGKPTRDTYEAALRVLYYLHFHRHIGLRYGASTLDLSSMSDSDWAVATPLHHGLRVSLLPGRHLLGLEEAKLHRALVVRGRDHGVERGR